MKSTESAVVSRREKLLIAGLLMAVMVLFFWQSLVPGMVHFSNDGPLGVLKVAWGHLPEAFRGSWVDLNTIGSSAGAWPTSLAALARWVLGPVGYAKFFVPLVLWVVGMGAWFCFRRLGLSPWAAGLGALATALNSDFFSLDCWGLGSHVLAFGLAFVAIGLVVSNTSAVPVWRRWARLAVAGFAVGMGVIEAADVGAIFSLMVAAFIVYEAWSSEGPLVARIGRGVGRTACIAFFAAFIASSTVYSLVSTQIKGVEGAAQDAQSRVGNWDFATQWSFPKKETLSLVVPGLFGYRMDSPEGMNYWGQIGRNPVWERYEAGGRQGPAPQAEFRFSGSGCYLGVPVMLVALWAALQSLRRGSRSVYSLYQRRLLWFWAAVALVSLLLSYGRFAPFYQFIYALPYFSTIRNPIKYLNVLSFAVLILFAYGVDGLWRTYLTPSAVSGPGWIERFRRWWARAGRFDHAWFISCLAVLALGLIGWWVYRGNRSALEDYLHTVQFDNDALAARIADFSIGQVACFAGLLAVALAWMFSVFIGVFGGARAKWAGLLLGLLVLIDLGRASQPWVKYWDYEQKYATNPIIDMLRDKPYEHRVAILPHWFASLPFLTEEGMRAEQEIEQVYRIEWAQHHFYFYNVQSLDLVQMPRMPADLVSFEQALSPDPARPVLDTIFRVARRWELTNTRYLIGAAGFQDFLNKQLDGGKNRFRVATTFDFVPKPGIEQPRELNEYTAELMPQGHFALYEFTGALPRAKLFTRWQVSTNDSETLKLLGSASFDPQQTVLVDDEISPAQKAADSADAAVQFVNYAPKRLTFSSKASAPAVLLVSDRYDSHWKVWVDGQPAKVLRCNFIMRGVSVPAGEHRIEFRFEPLVGPFYITVAALVLAVLLIAALSFCGCRCCGAPQGKESSEKTPQSLAKPEKRK